MNSKLDYRTSTYLNYKNYPLETSYINNFNSNKYNYNNYITSEGYTSKNIFEKEREINLNRNQLNRKQKKIYKTPERNTNIYGDRSIQYLSNNIRNINNLNNSRMLYTKYNNMNLNKSSNEGNRYRNYSEDKNSSLAYSMRNNNYNVFQMKYYQNLYNHNNKNYNYNFSRTPSPIRRENLSIYSNSNSNQNTSINNNNKKEEIIVDLKKNYKNNYIYDYGSKSSSNAFSKRNNSNYLISNSSK
jgi:hypothetical protein